MMTSNLRGLGVGLSCQGLVLGVSAAALPTTVVHADGISWVNWTLASDAGPYELSGSDGSSALSVSASVSSRATGNWFQASSNILDPRWAFGNQTTTYWQIYEIGAFQSTMTIDFLNAGGLAAGGSISIADVENIDSAVRVSAYQWNGASYQQVSVNWVLSDFVLSPSSVAAIWNPVTSTLSGSGAPLVGGISTMSVLSSNIRLDRVVLDITLPTSDGVGVGLTTTDIGAATVPAPGVAALFALFGVARRRSRK